MSTHMTVYVMWKDNPAHGWNKYQVGTHEIGTVSYVAQY